MAHSAEGLSLDELRHIVEKRELGFSMIIQLHDQLKSGLGEERPDLRDLRALMSVQNELIEEMCHYHLLASWGKL